MFSEFMLFVPAGQTPLCVFLAMIFDFLLLFL